MHLNETENKDDKFEDKNAPTQVCICFLKPEARNKGMAVAFQEKQRVVYMEA